MQPPLPLTLAPGQVVAGGRYLLTGELGRGGFGIVYRAEQRALGREVALKVLLPTMRDPEKALLRFRREAELAQRLEHPNTVRIYDFGQLETGHWFIALELLRGAPLDAALYRSAFSVGRTARVATQILKSLMEAHARGVVHRDLKPQNIFLCDFSGETDFVKVLDFGVAKLHDESDGRPVTQGGQVIGTPAYMAPEQVTGGLITPATDLYSLGLVIAECMTGRPVVAPTTPMNACMLQSSANLLPLEPAVTMSAFGPIVTRAIQKNPAARYQSADEMMREVERLMSMGSNETAQATIALPLGAGPSARPIATTPMHMQLAPSAPPPMHMQMTPSAPPLNMQSTAMNVAQPTLSQTTQSGAVVMSRGAFATILVLAGLLLVVTAVGGGFYFYSRGKADVAVKPIPPDPLSSAAPQDGSLANVTADELRIRFEKAGLKVTMGKPNVGSGYVVSSLTFFGNGMSGLVQLCDYESEIALIAMEDSARKTMNAAYKRDGHKFLGIYASTKPDSDKLLRIALAK